MYQFRSKQRMWVVSTYQHSAFFGGILPNKETNSTWWFQSSQIGSFQVAGDVSFQTNAKCLFLKNPFICNSIDFYHPEIWRKKTKRAKFQIQKIPATDLGYFTGAIPFSWLNGTQWGPWSLEKAMWDEGQLTRQAMPRKGMENRSLSSKLLERSRSPWFIWFIIG